MEEEKDLKDVIHEIEAENEKTIEENEKLIEPQEVKEEVSEPKIETPVETTPVSRTPVVPVEEKKEEPSKENKSKKKIIIIISSIMLFLIILAIVLIILLSGKKKYTITFDTAGGDKIDSVVVEKGNTVPEPVKPTKEGYIFNGWEYEGLPYYFTDGVTKDMTIKASWTIDTKPKEGDHIKVTYKFNNGEDDKIVEVVYNNLLKEPEDPIYEGYEFNGWYREGQDYEYSFYEPVIEPFTLEAKWEKPKDNEYIVNFSTDGGSRIESQTIKKGNKVVEPKDPTKDGYIFVEWQLNGVKYDFDKEVTSNLTLTAKWESNIVITFDSKGGSTVESQKVEYGKTVTKPTDPKKDGATFDGWYLNDKKYNFEDKVTESFTLTAKWIETTSDKVTCSITSTEDGVTMKLSLVGHLDNSGKINKLSYEYEFKDNATANTYCGTMKEMYSGTECTGNKIVIPDATSIQEENGESVVGMTKEEFITSAKKDDSSAICN